MAMADLTHTAGRGDARPGLLARMRRFWLPEPVSVAPASEKPQSRAGKWPDPTNVLASRMLSRPVDSVDATARHESATLKK